MITPDRPVRNIVELRSFYVKHRLEHLPSGGDFMSVIQQDQIIDVHELVGAEFDVILADHEKHGAADSLPRSIGPDELRSGQQVAYADGHGRWKVADGGSNRLRGSEKLVLLSEAPVTQDTRA